MSSASAKNRIGFDRPVAIPRTLALLGIVAVTASYCSTLYWVTTVAGGAEWLAGAIAIGLGAGVTLRHTDEERIRRVAAGGAILAGAVYYVAAPATIEPDMVVRVVRDSLAMLTGVTVLRLAAVEVWIAGLVPIPVFLSTYLALRGRYTGAALSGSWLVLFLALTGDATLLETLVGTVGAVVAVGFGELDRRGGSVRGAEVLVALLALMAVLAIAVPVVPSGSVGPFEPNSGVDADTTVGGDGGGPETVALDEQLLSGDDVTMTGPINMTPDVRFLVQADRGSLWRVGTLDTYTGEGWIRVGQSRPYFNALTGPPGDSRTVTQEYELRTEADAIAAASYPVDVSDNVADQIQVTSTGSLAVDGRLPPGTNYTIESEVPTPSVSTLQSAGTDYPTAIERRYTRLRNDTVPERVHNLSDQVTSEASTPYEEATTIESYLEDNWEYSQNVSEPEGSMVDGFLFEMDAGYCTYYASAMATMLRTQGVPARVAVGYDSGQWARNDTWVVRGTDAHAWVEVYFPDVGWVSFDPTPGAERDDARRQTIQSARQAGSNTTDVPESAAEPIRFEEPVDAAEGSSNGSQSNTDGTPNGTDAENSVGGGGGAPGTPSGYSGLGYSIEGDGSSVDYVEPNLETLVRPGGTNANGTAPLNATNASEDSPLRSGQRVLGGLDGLVVAVLLVAGTVAGGRRMGLQRRLRYAGRVLWQPRRSPESDAERASKRLEELVEDRYEPRRPGETWRSYRRRLPRSVDDDVRSAIELHERVHYAGELDPETVEEFVNQVDQIARSDLPIP